MLYERTRQIEQRFQQTIFLIKQDSCNARQLATRLHVSQSTLQRIIAELKLRGYVIRSVRDSHGWHYELVNTPQSSGNGVSV
jgi:DNA-binding MarR family transcriptional regulator